jgi:steroid delta-isomerase-like uncharacterized protein
MSIEANKALVRRLVEGVWSTGNLAAADEILAPNMVDHAAQMGGGAGDREGFKNQVRMFRAAFPDGHTRIDDMIAEGDKVVLRWTDGGTHRGEFMGIAATGRPVTITGIDIYCIADGKVVEYWCNEDELGLLRQLGAIPAPG